MAEQIKVADRTEGDRSVKTEDGYVNFYEDGEEQGSIDITVAESVDDAQTIVDKIVNDWLNRNIDENELAEVIESKELI